MVHKLPDGWKIGAIINLKGSENIWKVLSIKDIHIDNTLGLYGLAKLKWIGGDHDGEIMNWGNCFNLFEVFNSEINTTNVQACKNPP